MYLHTKSGISKAGQVCMVLFFLKDRNGNLKMSNACFQNVFLDYFFIVLETKIYWAKSQAKQHNYFLILALMYSFRTLEVWCVCTQIPIYEVICLFQPCFVHASMRFYEMFLQLFLKTICSSLQEEWFSPEADLRIHFQQGSFIMALHYSSSLPVSWHYNFWHFKTSWLSRQNNSCK